jgi:hypothetical protein
MPKLRTTRLIHTRLSSSAESVSYVSRRVCSERVLTFFELGRS